jgi:photosystem II stability/assembly factor-like uncharacterized protein
MNASRYAAAALALAVLAAGCGSASRPAHTPSSPAVALSLTTAVTGPGATWAAVPMGAASGANQFWQLFMLPAGGGQWSLQTPPDIATNGALILAGPAGQGIIVGERPSLYLTFSAITTTSDGGNTWATLPPVSGLAGVPDALAAASGGRMIALSGHQDVSVTRGAGSWAPLTTRQALAATPAARACALTGLTAAAYTPAGSPMLAGTCGRAGIAGIFGYDGGTWHQAAPSLPAALAGQPVRVLRLSQSGRGDVALLQAGTAPTASLIGAWTTDGGRRWKLSAPFGLGGAHAVSVSFGSGGGAAVVLSGHRGATLAGPGASWRALPPLPPGRTVTLALPAAGTTDALAADGSSLTIWQLRPGPAAWARTQAIKVPIPYGSSS